MNVENMAKALVSTGSGTAIIANMSTAGGLTVAAVGTPAIIVGAGAAMAIAVAGYSIYVGYGALKKKLEGSN
jgi:hypothetical protein